MTPLAVEMLVWFHTRAPEAGPFANIERGPQSEIVDWFRREGVIVQIEGPPHTFRTTPKGDVWMSLILATPMPMQRWIDPRSERYAEEPVDGNWFEKAPAKPTPEAS